MNIEEYNKVYTLDYNSYCNYLQTKYGIGLSDYMTKSFNKNQKVSRTKDGLFAHHKMEDRMVMLSTPKIARMFPLEWQSKENIVYCDYLEHLYLHILICKYPSAEKINIAKVGIGGVVNFLAPELNDIYSGWEPKAAWKKNCVDKVKNDKEVYIQLIKRFISENINDNYFSIEKLKSSFNEQYGLWSNSNNKSIYLEIDQIYHSEELNNGGIK